MQSSSFETIKTVAKLHTTVLRYPRLFSSDRGGPPNGGRRVASRLVSTFQAQLIGHDGQLQRLAAAVRVVATDASLPKTILDVGGVDAVVGRRVEASIRAEGAGVSSLEDARPRSTRHGSDGTQ